MIIKDITPVLELTYEQAMEQMLCARRLSWPPLGQPIPVKYIETNYGTKFINHFEKWYRLWIYSLNPNEAPQTLGSYCPHLSMNGFECMDCGGCYD